MICNMGITLEIDFQDLQKCNKALFLKTSEYKSSSSSSFPRPLFFNWETIIIIKNPKVKVL